MVISVDLTAGIISYHLRVRYPEFVQCVRSAFSFDHRSENYWSM